MQAAAVATVAAVGLSAVGETPAHAADIKLKDVAGHPDQKAIKALIEKGMINGYPDGTFKPDRQLTRSDITLIIGRYLVQLGYAIPNNAKTSMRFNDLNRNSDGALLNYAALLYDEGILLGDHYKRLNPKENLTREQLALILTRAFTIIDDFDYTTYVAGQKFVREYGDTLSLTQQSQAAINVFDYYDIVEDENYFPKEIATRGQFATMTYKMMQLKEQQTSSAKLAIESWDVISAKRVKFTMTDGTTEDILLDEPLVENVPTQIDVKIKGRSFSPTVVYRVEQLKVVNVENINAGQFVVHFNQEVDLVDSYVDSNSSYWQGGYWYQSQQNVSKFFKLTDRSGRIIPLQKGEISEDRKSFTITIDEQRPLLGTYNLKINGVHAFNGVALPSFEDSYYFEADFERPEIIETEHLSTNVVKVKFSEPVYGNLSSLTYKIGSDVVTGVKASYLDNYWTSYKNTTEIIFDLSNARYRFGTVPANVKIDVTANGLRDVANNYFLNGSNSYTFQIKKEGNDNRAPRLVSVDQIGAKQFKLTFNEPMSRIYGYQIRLESPLLDYNVEAVTPVEGDPTSFIVTTDEYLEGNIQISSHEYYSVYDATGTKGKFSKNYKFKYDTSRAKVVQTRVVRENNLEYLFVQFDRNVEIRKNASAFLDGHYMVGQLKHILYNPEKAQVFPVKDDKKTVKIPLNQLVHTYDREGATYYTNLQFENVVTEYGQPAITANTTFTRKTDYNLNAENLEIVSVHTSRTNRSIKDHQLVVITFNLPVQKKLAEDTYHYDLGPLKVKSAQLNPANPNQVLLSIDTAINSYPRPDVTKPFEGYLYVWNLQAEKSVHAMTPYYEPVYFTESTPPAYRTGDFISNTEIKMTFSEALTNIEEDTFIVTDRAGNRLAATAKIDPSNNSNVLITLEKPLSNRQTVTVKLQANRSILDTSLNEGVFTQRDFTYR